MSDAARTQNNDHAYEGFPLDADFFGTETLVRVTDEGVVEIEERSS